MSWNPLRCITYPCRAKVRWTVAICLVLITTLPGVAHAHVESTLFLEHPPKTAFGVLSKTTSLDLNEDKTATALVPFAEYAPSPRFSLGVGLPGGRFDGDSLLSDMVLAAKGLFHYKENPVVPLVSLEVPTGDEPATSEHTELTVAVFTEKMTSRYHLYGSAGGRTSLSGDGDEHGDEHGDQEINVFAPHADEEIFGSLGLTWWLNREPMFGLDGRVTAYYEDFEEVAPELQLGVVFQKEHRGTVYKASLDGFLVTDGVREGTGIGFSFYIAP